MGFTVGNMKQCKAINAKRSNKNIGRRWQEDRTGHFAKVCQLKVIHNIKTNVNNTSTEETETYQLNIWNV